MNYILQVDFPTMEFLVKSFQKLLVDLEKIRNDIAKDGLLWKIWTENEARSRGNLSIFK